MGERQPVRRTQKLNAEATVKVERKEIVDVPPLPIPAAMICRYRILILQSEPNSGLWQVAEKQRGMI